MRAVLSALERSSSLLFATVTGIVMNSASGIAMADTTFINDFLTKDAPFKKEFQIGGHEADLQLYAVVDIAVAHQNHSLPANRSLPNNLYPYQGASNTSTAVGSQTEWIGGGLQDSRFGFKGGMELFNVANNKVRLVFQVEEGFNPIGFHINDAALTLAQNSGAGKNSSVNADSSLNGDTDVFFNRTAWAGISAGNYGQVSYGIQYNPFYEIFGRYDPTDKADTFSPLGESGTVGGGGGISENSRMPNSVKYSNSFQAPMSGKVNLAGMYQFGNASGDTADGYGATAQVGYENSLFGIQFAYDYFEDALKAGNGKLYGTISAGLYNTEATLIALKVTPTKDLRFSGGWEWYKYTPSSDPVLQYNVLFNQTLFGGLAKSALAADQSQDNNVYFLGAKFDFAERVPMLAGLSTAVGFYATRFDAVDTPLGPKAGTQGDIDTWTIVADYAFNKRFDTYVAYTDNHFYGAKFPSSTTHSYVDLVGVGVRMKF